MPDLDQIPGLGQLRALGLDGRGVRIAILDGRPDLEHDCFAGASIQYLDGTWLFGNAERAEWAVEHATGIASIVIGQPGSAVRGIAPGVHAIFIEAIRDADSAVGEFSLARSIEIAVQRRPDIIHVAHCIPSQTSRAGDLLRRALEAARAAGALVVAPSGNDGGANNCLPSDQPNVLAVGGLDDDGSVRPTSNYGRPYDGHGVMAWAENLEVAAPGGGTRREGGTSGAAPQVSAVAALLLSAARADGLDTSPVDVGRIIRESARPLTDPDDRRRAIGGVLDAGAALRTLLGDRAPHAVEPPSNSTVRSAVEPSTDSAPASPTDTGASLSLRLPSRLFAIGQIGVDLLDDTTRQSLTARMTTGMPEDVRALGTHLRTTPEDAELLSWVLTSEGQPIYALRPVGPSADDVHRRLVEVLIAGIGAPPRFEAIERASIAGVVTTQTLQLYHGQIVPIVAVHLPEGISGWRTVDLVREAATIVAGTTPPGVLLDALTAFVSKVYDDRRNDGTLGRDRALNYAATNLVQAALALQSAVSAGLTLERLDVVKSRFDRPFSLCWDVQVWCFDPERKERSRRVWIWTVDVADERPVGVGIIRSWAVDESWR